MKFNPNESLDIFLTEFEKTVHELKNFGGQIQNSEVITRQILSAMPESYQCVTTAIDVLFCQVKTRREMCNMQLQVFKENQQLKIFIRIKTSHSKVTIVVKEVIRKLTVH